MLAAALSYAAKGWQIFPAPAGAKKSHKAAEHSNGVRWGSTCDPDEIRADFTKWPDANVGIATGADSGFFVIDCDTPAGHDVDGIASLRALEAEHGALPETLTAESPTGSLHFYFAWPANAHIGNSTSKIAPGVDVRGEGGMVIVPPSLRPGVGPYRWRNHAPIADAPEWLIGLATAKANGDDYGRKVGNGADRDPPRATREQIIAALKAVPADDYQTWFEIGAALHHELGENGQEIFHEWSRKSAKFDARACDEKWAALGSVTGFTAGTIFHYANASDPNWRASESPTLNWLDMRSWDEQPAPSREWAIPDRTPRRQAGLFSGEGGAGKSIIEMMKNVAHVAGKEWLGALPAKGPAIYLGCEDDESELHRRFETIARHYGVTFAELVEGGLHALCKFGDDAVLAAVNPRTGKVTATEFYDQLYEAAGDIKPVNISIDTLSRVFAGNEIDRVQVYAFAMHMQALAMVAGGSVTVLSHPSLAGIASGSGISGSTAWHGAFRFRQYLKSAAVTEDQPDTDLRQLEFKKNQYGPAGESIALKWQHGLFLPIEHTFVDQTRDDALFLELLDKFTTQGRNVSHIRQSNNFAPMLFTELAPGKKSALTAAMVRLFEAGKIKVEVYGSPSRQRARIVRV